MRFRHGLRFEGPSWGGHWWGTEDPRWLKHLPWRTRKYGPPISRHPWRELFQRPWFSGGPGGDEYGNPSLYFRCPLFGVVWDYPTGHYQTDIEIPEFGENAWVDRVFYQVE